MKPRVGDVVEVVWRDSMQIAMGWDDAAAYRARAGIGADMRTAGYFLAMNDDHILVALGMSTGTGHTTQAMTIPRENVRSIRVCRRSAREVRKALR